METVGVTLGAIGLLGLLGTCIEVIQFGFVAKDRKSQVQTLSGQLDFEAILLRRWAENVLLVSNEGPDSVRVLPLEYCKLINDTIERMIDLFNESSGLVSKYSEDKQHEALSILRRQPQAEKRLFRLISRNNIGRRSSFRWAIRDAAKLETLVRHLELFRRKLEELLPPNIELLKLQILIDTVSASTPDNMETIRGAAVEMGRRNPSDAPTMNSIRAAVSIREQLPQWTIQADLAQATIQHLFIQDARFGSDLPLDLSPWYISLSSTIRNIRDKDVLIEWRFSEPGTDKFIFERDIIQLASLLSSLTDHPNIHLPSCLGYIKDENFPLGVRYGLVLAIPTESIHDALNPVTTLTPSTPVSLHDEIIRTPYPLPELSIRLGLARGLVASLFHLMSTGWYHKGIRSSNIILLKPPSILPTSTLNLLQDPAFVLTGFQFARQNQPGQISLNAKGSASLDIYRHPSAISTKWTTAEYINHGYLKEYDIYSFGVVLAEIGLWKTAGDILEKATRRGLIRGGEVERYREVLVSKVKAELGGMMGAQFREIVEWCLQIEQDDDDEDLYGVKVLDGLEEKVLRALDRLRF